MSLALVRPSIADFDRIHSHLVSYRPEYRNMHLREACTRNGRRDLRYLHTMYAPEGNVPEIHGMICGPGVFWHYTLRKARGGILMIVHARDADDKAEARILERFLREVFVRVAQEQAGPSPIPPRRTPGQLYLRRWSPGTQASHETCEQAVAEHVLDRRFVACFARWNFQLWRR